MKKRNLINKAKKISAEYHYVRLAIAIQKLKADNLIASGDRQKGILMLENSVRDAMRMELNYLSMDLLIHLPENHSQENPQKSISLLLGALKMAEEKSS